MNRKIILVLFVLVAALAFVGCKNATEEAAAAATAQDLLPGTTWKVSENVSSTFTPDAKAPATVTFPAGKVIWGVVNTDVENWTATGNSIYFEFKGSSNRITVNATVAIDGSKMVMTEKDGTVSNWTKQ